MESERTRMVSHLDDDIRRDSRRGWAIKKKEKENREKTRRRHDARIPTASFGADDDWATYLNIKMKSTKREKNTATLSMVRSITNSCRRRLGRKRTNFRILRRRKVRKTLRPELPPRSSTNAWQSSTTLKTPRANAFRIIGYPFVVSVRSFTRKP